MIRKATLQDVDQINEIYNDIHTEEENGRLIVEWARDVYPTKQTAIDGIKANEMFVMEIDGEIVAAAKINQEQEEEYEQADWTYEVENDQIMVLHTLVVSPKHGKKGYGKRFVEFYEEYASYHGCKYLRMDTSSKNLIARKLYNKLGYKEVSILPSVFNGLSFGLVCLEKKIEDE